MQNIIVLGLIPGTHIQINFMMWFVALTASFSLTLLIKEWRAIRVWVIAHYVAHLIKRHRLAA